MVHGAAASAASAASGMDGCHGYVSHFYRSAGRVYLHAHVACSRTEDKIVVTAFLRRGDTWSRPGAITCTHVSSCTAVASLSDPKGSQRHSGGVAPGHYPPATYVTRGGRTVTCDSGMSCELAGTYF